MYTHSLVFYRFILPYWTNATINFWMVGKLAMIFSPFRNVFITASSWLVAAIAIDRFILIKLSTKAKVLSSNKRTYIVIVVISILSVAVNIPQIYDINEVPAVIDSCTGSWRYIKIIREDNSTYTPLRSQKTYKIVKLVLSVLIDYVLPVAVINVLNFVTIRLLRSKRKIGSENSQAARRRIADLKLVKMITVVSVVFMICVLPETILRICRIFLSAVSLHKALPIVQIFLMINVAANFVVYCLLNKHLFEALKTLCGKCFKRDKKVSDNSSGTTSTTY